jgi:hypothetical protein
MLSQPSVVAVGRVVVDADDVVQVVADPVEVGWKM